MSTRSDGEWTVAGALILVVMTVVMGCRWAWLVLRWIGSLWLTEGRACDHCISMILTIWLRVIVQAELLFQPLKTDSPIIHLPDLSQLLYVPITTDELDKITSNMGTIFSNTLETVAPIKLKVREKLAAPWYNSYTHSLKKETCNLEHKWRKTNLEVLRIAWKTVCPAIERL